MTMLRDEMSGRNDPYKKPKYYQPEWQRQAHNLMTGQEWYDRAMVEVAAVFRSRPQNDYDFGIAIRKALLRAAGLTDKENTDASSS